MTDGKSGIPDRLPVKFLDVFQYSQESWAVLQVHVILDFAGQLDRQRLGRAMELSMDAAPVLGCCLVPRRIFPYWKRLGQQDLSAGNLLRALSGMADKDTAGALRLSQTVDLRKYLPDEKARSICH